MISLFLNDIARIKAMHIKTGSSLRSAIKLMDRNQRGVVVVLDGKKPVGILTERDILELLAKGVDLNSSVDRHAKKGLITTQGNRTIGHVLNLMLENNIRRMIVLDDSGNFAGLVTQKDMLNHLEDDFYRSTIKVKHIMEKLRLLISMAPEDRLEEALKKMIKNKVSAVPVTEDGKAVGIITEKDIISLSSRNVALKGRIDRYMSRPVHAAGFETSLVDIVKIMNKHSISRVVINDAKGKAVGIITIRDVLKNIEGDYSEFLERRLKYAKDLLNLLPEMLIEVSDTEAGQLVIWVNNKVKARFGGKIIDRPVTELIYPKKWGKIYAELLKTHNISDVKFKKGSSIYEVSGFMVETEGKTEKRRIQLIMRDVTEDIRLSTTDHLTSLYNRRFIIEFLAKEIERNSRMAKQFSIVIADIDDFKKLNDTHGHAAGDEALKAFSRVMVKRLRKADIIGRYGGEEFMIIMPETRDKTAVRVINRLRKTVEDSEIMLRKGKKIKMTASFGIACFPEDGVTPDDLLIAADDRLYQAKKEGKNRVVFA